MNFDCLIWIGFWFRLCSKWKQKWVKSTRNYESKAAFFRVKPKWVINNNYTQRDSKRWITTNCMRTYHAFSSRLQVEFFRFWVLTFRDNLNWVSCTIEDLLTFRLTSPKKIRRNAVMYISGDQKKYNYILMNR